MPVQVIGHEGRNFGLEATSEGRDELHRGCRCGVALVVVIILVIGMQDGVDVVRGQVDVRGARSKLAAKEHTYTAMFLQSAGRLLG